MYSVQIAKIYHSLPEKNRHLIQCYQFSPPLLQKELLGEVFILLQIKIPKNINLKIGLIQGKKLTEIIINGLKTNYYHPEQIKRTEKIEEIFEESLQKINRLLYQEIISDSHLEEFGRNLNAIITVVKENKIFFAQAHSPLAFLIRKRKITEFTSSEEKFIFTPSKIFSHIISGEIEDGDIIFFSSDNFFDYFSKEDLQKYVEVKNIPLSEAVKNLENILGNLKDQISCGSFFLKISPDKLPEKIQEQISEKITPPTTDFEKLKEEKIPLQIKFQPTPEETKKIFIKEKISWKRKIGSKIPTITLPTVNFNFLSKIKDLPKGCWFKLKKINSLLFSLNQIKILGMIIFLLVILLTYSFIIIGRQKARESQNDQFFTTFQSLQEKNTLLKAAIKYENKNSAQSLISELKADFAAFSAQNVRQKTVIGKIWEEFTHQVNQLYKISELEKPKIIYDFSSVNKKIKINSLIKLDNRFIVSDLENQNLYQLDLTNKKISLLIKDIGNFTYSIYYRPSAIILYQPSKISIFDLEKIKIYPLKIETERKTFTIQDLKIYEKKLYFLDLSVNQIFRYLEIKDGFSKETPWLKEKIDLQSVVSFAIDGSIYLLKKNGEILKFYLGKKQTFSLEKIEPQITKPIKIMTGANLKNIYLLEASEQRLIVFNKEGKLVKQITSPQFDALKDLIIEEKETRAWLLNNQQVIEVEL